MGNFLEKSKFSTFKITKVAVLCLLKLPNLISHKIWVSKSENCKLAYPGLYVCSMLDDCSFKAQNRVFEFRYKKSNPTHHYKSIIWTFHLHWKDIIIHSLIFRYLHSHQLNVGLLLESEFIITRRKYFCQEYMKYLDEGYEMFYLDETFVNGK